MLHCEFDRAWPTNYTFTGTLRLEATQSSGLFGLKNPNNTKGYETVKNSSPVSLRSWSV